MKTCMCDACGREIEPEFAVKHRIVPEEIASLYGISDSLTTTLCSDCSVAIRSWYQKKVSTLMYDSGIKRFRSKTPVEMANEYHHVYQGFVDFKRKRRKRIKRL